MNTDTFSILLPIFWFLLMVSLLLGNKGEKKYIDCVVLHQIFAFELKWI